MAFRTRRRRKPRVAWLPTFGAGTTIENEDIGLAAAGVKGSISTGVGSDVVYDAFPLTFDKSLEADAAATEDRSLQDLVSGNEWRLRRIVGKAFIAAQVDDFVSGEFTHQMDVAVGFIVCKTYDDGAPTTDFGATNPLARASMEDPWIWRRRWVLSPYGNVRNIDVTTSTLNAAHFEGYPSTTAGYGSVMDGPHIDAKTARVIHRSERLFCVIATRNLVEDSVITATPGRIQYLLDYRLLGSLRPSSSGNRHNASR